MRQLITRIGASVRHALGKPIIPALAARVEAAVQKAAVSKLPQATRLFILYQQTKRQYKKRRLGMSAKSPEVGAHHRRLRADKLPCSHQRLAPAIGPNSYEDWKHECAAARAQRRLAL